MDGLTRTRIKLHHDSQLQSATDQSLADPEAQRMMTEWAQKVRSTVNVLAILENIHRSLVGSAGVRSAIKTCGEAFWTEWRLRKEVPFDDRQYYNSLVAYLTDRIAYQAQGVRCVSC